MAGKGWTPPYRPKVCVQCNGQFIPNSGRQVRCDECQPKVKRRYAEHQKPRLPQRRTENDAGYRRTRRKRQISPALALSIEERLKKRMEAMEDEENDGAT